ncbi:MAG TPA: VOC family protein [Streptosporangiaceae bacterium]
MDHVRHGALHHVELWVPNLDRAVATWGWLLGELGYELFQDWPGGQSWRSGPTYIVLEQSPARTASRHDRSRPGLNHLAFHVATAALTEALATAASQHGWRLMFPEQHPYAGGRGHYAAYLENVDGYEAELVAIEVPAALADAPPPRTAAVHAAAAAPPSPVPAPSPGPRDGEPQPVPVRAPAPEPGPVAEPAPMAEAEPAPVAGPAPVAEAEPAAEPEPAAGSPGAPDLSAPPDLPAPPDPPAPPDLPAPPAPPVLTAAAVAALAEEAVAAEEAAWLRELVEAGELTAEEARELAPAPGPAPAGMTAGGAAPDDEAPPGGSA